MSCNFFLKRTSSGKRAPGDIDVYSGIYGSGGAIWVAIRKQGFRALLNKLNFYMDPYRGPPTNRLML